MGPLQYILGAILLVAAIFLVVVVVLQNKAKRGLSGAIAGGTDSYLGKNGGMTSIGVAWGYCDVALLRENGAKAIVNDADELYKAIKNA